MKLTMRMTLDGLVRALRLDVHGLAEAIEGSYRREQRPRKRDAKLSERDAMARGEQENAGARR